MPYNEQDFLNGLAAGLSATAGIEGEHLGVPFHFDVDVWFRSDFTTAYDVGPINSWDTYDYGTLWQATVGGHERVHRIRISIFLPIPTYAANLPAQEIVPKCIVYLRRYDTTSLSRVNYHLNFQFLVPSIKFPLFNVASPKGGNHDILSPSDFIMDFQNSNSHLYYGVGATATIYQAPVYTRIMEHPQTPFVTNEFLEGMLYKTYSFDGEHYDYHHTVYIELVDFTKSFPNDDYYQQMKQCLSMEPSDLIPSSDIYYTSIGGYYHNGGRCIWRRGYTQDFKATEKVAEEIEIGGCSTTPNVALRDNGIAMNVNFDSLNVSLTSYYKAGVLPNSEQRQSIYKIDSPQGIPLELHEIVPSSGLKWFL